MIEKDDTDLVRQCLAGNKKAFERLVEKYHKTIFNIVYRMTRNYEDSADITQSVFLKTYENLGAFKPKFKFFSWLYRIVVNEALNFIKSGKKLSELDSKLISTEKNPEQKYADIELGVQVQSALMELDPEYRILILLKHFQHCSYQEISESLGLPLKKVKSRLYSARQMLKDILIRRGTL